MNDICGQVLVVDDSSINRLLLTQALQMQGHTVTALAGGAQALELLEQRGHSIDVVLLDVVMPEMDGYQVLQRIKANVRIRELPVIMISALEELESVVRCIELGAEDYLTKPYQPSLLRARMNACLEKKRLRDQEVEYLRNVDLLTSAASSVEAEAFDPATLEGVARRQDALGQLARVFLHMAEEVHAREQRLKSQLQQLRLDMEERRRAETETVSVYVPMDRRHALARGQDLPQVSQGVALFADISGFTPLTESLAVEFGPQRGAEEITRHINGVFCLLIEAVHRYGGSVVGFAGDAITCWFEGDTGPRATACALDMQQSLGGTAERSLAIKVAVAGGAVSRFLVGDPQIQLMEVLAGRTLESLAQIEAQARPGEVLLQAQIAASASTLRIVEWRGDGLTGQRCAVVQGSLAVAPQPWPELSEAALEEERVRPWLAPAVFERIRGGNGSLLSELRPAAVLFLRFGGIDFDEDERAGERLECFVRWVQRVLCRYEGTLLQLTVGDKGSYLYAAFGAPLAHEDDAVRAAASALDLSMPPPDLGVTASLGLAYGQMRAGAYGGPAHRSYGVLGDRTNLAARFMQLAGPGEILCDERIHAAALAHMHFEPLAPVKVKGKTRPVPVFRLISAQGCTMILSRLDKLTPPQQALIKLASVIGPAFPLATLRALCTSDVPDDLFEEGIDALVQAQFVERRGAEGVFKDVLSHEAVYDLLLFAQRRQLHRAVAEYYECLHAGDLSSCYSVLAEHWLRAEELRRASHYLELAGQQAQARGALEEAADFFRQSLNLENYEGA